MILARNLLLFAAPILFCVAAFPVSCRFNLVAAGLAAWVASELLPIFFK